MRRGYYFKSITLVVITTLIMTTGGVIIFPQTSYAMTYNENFFSTTYEDSANTNARWDTSAGLVKLTQFWAKADGVTSGYDNVSSNSGSSWNPQIELSSDNKPFVVWRDKNITTGNYEIFFSKWNGSQ